MNQAHSHTQETQESTTFISTFFQSFESLQKPEEKLRLCIDFMHRSLSQSGTPSFKEFWDVRKLCLPIFKEPLPGLLRSQLWGEYIDLTREGRHLKNILDEETAFAVEQIELAVLSIEEEIRTYDSNYEALLEKSVLLEFPDEPKALEGQYTFYQQCQQKLCILNVFASRINALRKELIKTEMRIRQKNKFFQRLSALGDKVFPLRKELIKDLSEAFVQDVQAFVRDHFSEENFSPEAARRSVFFFRGEIKILQSLAKLFTLNTQAFSTTRELLSQCWDKLKGMEKELKKEFAIQKHKSSENVELIHKKIQEIVASYEQGNLSSQDCYKEIDKVARWMREVELTHVDVRFLKEALKAACQPVDANLAQENEQRLQKENAIEEERQKIVTAFMQKMDAFFHSLTEIGPEEGSKELEKLRKEVGQLSLSKTERQHFETFFKKCREQIAENEELILLTLSDDDRAVLENLQLALVQRLQKRKDIKTQIEEYRKVMGGSGLDFEKAMEYNELMAVEKENLEKIDEKIYEIEKKIKNIKKLS